MHKRKDCIGCARCFFAAPHTWSINENDGLADLKNGVWKNDHFVVSQIEEDVLEDNQNAADTCPTGIIRIEGYNT